MPGLKRKLIYTVGHSTRTFEAFVAILDSFEIQFLADIRTFPGSKRYPHFNKESLQNELAAHGIIYEHFPGLGGRRKAIPGSRNLAWKNEAFRGYADHMETAAFLDEIDKLGEIASRHTSVYMCSEAVWWRCHRSLLSDHLKWKGWEVLHIMDKNKSVEHPYTSPAKIINGRLNYETGEATLF